MFGLVRLFNPEIVGEQLPNPLPSIFGLGWTSDKVLNAVTKLLLYTRIEETDSAGFTDMNWWRFPQCAFSNNPDTYTSVEYPDVPTNCVGVYNIQKLIATNYKDCVFDYIDKTYLKYNKGSVENFAIEKFFEQQGIRVKIYVNAKDKTSRVFADTTDLVLLEHALASVISALMPWLFKDKPLEDWETAILLSLNETTPDNFIEKFGNAMRKLDFRAKFIERALSSFGEGIRQRKINHIDDRIRDLRYVLADLESRLTNVLSEKQTYEDERRGLIERLEELTSTQEVLDFFKASKVLELVSARDGRLDFIVHTTLDNYDIDLCSDYLDNQRSVFYTANIKENISRASWIKFLKAVFIDRTIKVHMAQEFILNFYSSGYTFSSERLSMYECTKDCICNPHLTEFSCLGNNKVPLLKALSECDYISAITICIASTGNINMSETMNVGNLFSYLMNNRKNMCELPDGRRCNVLNAISWLEQEELNEQGN